MKQKIILNTLLDEIYQLESYVQSWRDQEVVPAIERDLVQRKLQEVYDQLLHLEVRSEPVKPAVLSPVNTVIAQPGPVQEIVFEPSPAVKQDELIVKPEIPLRTEPFQPLVEIPATQPVISEIKPEPTPQVQETIPEPVQVIQKEPVVEPIKESKPESEADKSKPGREILAEKLSQPHKLIIETIHTNPVMDVSSKLKNAPIPNIQSAINLNDKFVFIRELFKNNNLLYNQTIERLNQAAGYAEAVTILEKEFGWDMEEPLVQKLVELIRRKHNA